MFALQQLLIALFLLSANAKLYISNLSEKCMECLCHVNGCDLNHDCTDGYCGPFYLTRSYWIDAGKPILPDDDPVRREAFEDCARDYLCSVRAIEMYLTKYGKDCNKDGVTNCLDYVMINYNGGINCTPLLNLTADGRELLVQYKLCKL